MLRAHGRHLITFGLAAVVLIPMIAYITTPGNDSRSIPALSENDDAVVVLMDTEEVPITINQTRVDAAPMKNTKEIKIESVVRMLGSFTSQQKIHRKYVLIRPDLEDAAIINIAVQLHAQEPDTWYYLMDSDSEFDTMLKALPETEAGDYSNWPASYVQNHYVARIMQEIRPDGKGNTNRVWKLEGGPDRSHLTDDM